MRALPLAVCLLAATSMAQAEYVLKYRINGLQKQGSAEILVDGESVRLPSLGRFSIETPGTHTLTVTKATSIALKLWGAAGGGYEGGRGGYSYGELTLQPGIQYQLVVGEGGRLGNGSHGYEGGPGFGGRAGRPARTGYERASGGGLTGLFASTIDQTNAVLIAGGGGGAAPYSTHFGGNGGGLAGGNGGSAGNGGGGGGGTQAAGGVVGYSAFSSGSTSGEALLGGHGASSITRSYSGSGGGGGYFGGGGGGGNNYSGGMGGGGSSYANGTLVSNASLVRLSDRGGDVPNANDGDYVAGTAAPSKVGTKDLKAGDGLAVLIAQ